MSALNLCLESIADSIEEFLRALSQTVQAGGGCRSNQPYRPPIYKGCVPSNSDGVWRQCCRKFQTSVGTSDRRKGIDNAATFPLTSFPAVLVFHPIQSVFTNLRVQ